jgi:hypothetical protein
MGLTIFTGTGPAEGAPFRNLGFDEADTNQVSADQMGPISALLPGWQLLRSTNRVETVGVDPFLDIRPYASLASPAQARFVEGRYGVVLKDEAGMPFSLIQRAIAHA